MKKNIKLMINVYIIVVAVFLYMGFQYQLWSTMWVLYLLPPLVLLPSILKLDNSIKLAVLSLYAVSYGYVGFNMYYQLWHPSWLVFLLPVVIFLQGIKL